MIKYYRIDDSEGGMIIYKIVGEKIYFITSILGNYEGNWALSRYSTECEIRENYSNSPSSNITYTIKKMTDDEVNTFFMLQELNK
jgi:hypothetical protein